MKKGKLIFKENKYMIKYLDTYSGRDNGGFERDRTGWFEIQVDPNFPVDILESLLNEELEFQTKYHNFLGKNGWSYEIQVADIKLSVIQSREIKINQIIDNK